MEESGVAPMPGANDGRREPGPRGETPAGDDRIDITMIVETVMVLAVDGDGCQGPRLLAGAILIRQPSVGPRCPAACRTSPHVARPGNGCRLVRRDPSRIGSCATQDRTRAMGRWADGRWAMGDGRMGGWADGPGGCLDMALSSGASARRLPVPMLRRGAGTPTGPLSKFALANMFAMSEGGGDAIVRLAPEFHRPPVKTCDVHVCGCGLGLERWFSCDIRR